MTKELSPLNYINVGPKGTFKRSGQNQTTPMQVNILFDYLDQNAVNKLTIYFHGGLVSENSGMETATALAREFQQAGSHPVSFVWETGLLETITRNCNTSYLPRHFGVGSKV